MGKKRGSGEKDFCGESDWGIKVHQVTIVILPRGVKIFGSTTRTDYKVEQGVLKKQKVRLCAPGDLQAYGVDDTYSPVLKVTEVRLMTVKACLSL